MRRGARFNGYTALLRQLAAALRLGFPLPEVAGVLAQDTELRARDRRALVAFETALAGGASIPEAMEKLPRIFAPETSQWMRLAESAGTLPGALDALAADLARRADAERSYRLALIWPLAVSGAMAVVFVVVGASVIPAWKDIFGSFGVELPRLTRIVFAWGGLLFGGVWIPLIALLALGFTHRDLPTVVSDPIDGALYHLGFVGRFRRARFAARLIDLLRSHPADPLVLSASMAHLGATTETASLSRAALRLRDAVAAGSPLSQALSGEQALPRRFSLYTQLGERMHNLPTVLSDLHAGAEIELQESAARFERGAILMIYVVLGIVIGTFVVSVYLPAFKIGLLA